MSHARLFMGIISLICMAFCQFATMHAWDSGDTLGSFICGGCTAINAFVAFRQLLDYLNQRE